MCRIKMDPQVEPNDIEMFQWVGKTIPDKPQQNFVKLGTRNIRKHVFHAKRDLKSVNQTNQNKPILLKLLNI